MSQYYSTSWPYYPEKDKSLYKCTYVALVRRNRTTDINKIKWFACIMLSICIMICYICYASPESSTSAPASCSSTRTSARARILRRSLKELMAPQVSLLWSRPWDIACWWNPPLSGTEKTNFAINSQNGKLIAWYFEEVWNAKALL